MSGNNDFSHEIVGVNYEVACVAGANGGVEWIGRQGREAGKEFFQSLFFHQHLSYPSPFYTCYAG